MKTKSLLIVISLAALLFTSCERDEMEHGTGAGGGTLPDAMRSGRTINTPDTTSTESVIMKKDLGTLQTDSILNKDYLRQ